MVRSGGGLNEYQGTGADGPPDRLFSKCRCQWRVARRSPLAFGTNMNHRLRAAALIIRDRQLLLVKQFEGRTGEHYWLPPGGGVESTDLSVFDCAKRETLEETPVQIEASRIVYIREFIDFAYDFRNFEVFVLADHARGEAVVREFWPETRE